MWKIEPDLTLDPNSFQVTGPDGKKFLAYNRDDAQWLVDVLDEATNTTVKLYCLNPACRANAAGEFITRLVGDVKKNVYQCDICKKALGRKTPATNVVQVSASEKQAQTHPQSINPLDRVLTVSLPDTNKPRGITRGDLAALMQGKPMGEPPGATPTPAVQAPATAPVQDVRLSLLEDRVAKLESESAAQAEAVQTVLQMFDSIAGAKTS